MAWTDKEIKILKECWADPTATWKDVAKKTGKSRSAIYNYSKMLGLESINRATVKKGYYLCVKCNQLKPLSSYWGGKVGMCNACNAQYKKDLYKKYKAEGKVTVKYEVIKWTDKEIKILKECWKDPFATWKDVAEKTGKSRHEITNKANRLNLNKVRRATNAPEGHKNCIVCKMPRPIELFQYNKSVCNICIDTKLYREEEFKNKKKCYYCNRNKLISDFATSGERILGICKKCKQKQSKKYRKKNNN